MKNLDPMLEALRLAQRGMGRTHPNPPVGAVIVKGGKIVAEGHHMRAGRPHAEVVALRRAGVAARGADLYVTLEPCNHQGRTGPCTRAIIDAGIKRVFVAAQDPNPKVNGKGIRRLRQARIEVTLTREHAEAAGRLIEAYTWWVTQKTPFVVVKSAVSLDGRVTDANGESRWVTGDKARARGHVLRNQLDAIVVGVGTVIADDPQLTCRIRGGRDPIRVVFDSKAKTPVQSQVIQAAQKSKAPTWIVVDTKAPKARVRRLEAAGASILRVPTAQQGGLDVPAALRELGARDITSLLVEGGPKLVGSFVTARAVQRWVSFVAPTVLGGKNARCGVEGGGLPLGKGLDFSHVEVERVGRDLVIDCRVT